MHLLTAEELRELKEAGVEVVVTYVKDKKTVVIPEGAKRQRMLLAFFGPAVLYLDGRKTSTTEAVFFRIYLQGSYVGELSARTGSWHQGDRLFADTIRKRTLRKAKLILGV